MQVLLSQVHRLRALVLLGRFLDMGRWAVALALSVGIFPYVLKLLQTTALDLRQTLVFIWTKILALDRSCQVRHRIAHLALMSSALYSLFMASNQVPMCPLADARSVEAPSCFLKAALLETSRSPCLNCS